MKRIILLFALFVFVIHCFAQKETLTEITPSISSLVVYTEGVEFSHQNSVKLTEGRNLLVFKGLSSKLDIRSIRVNVESDVSVLAISSKTDFMSKNPDKPRIKVLKDSLNLRNAKMQLLKDELNAIAVQRELLMKNQELAGQSNGLNTLELQKAADFFQSRIFDLNKRVSQLNLMIHELDPEIQALTGELNETEAKCNFQRTEISVLVNVEMACQKQFDLRYYIADAGWAPYYEIKATEINQPITLIYRAKVFNNTDIDWTDVNMTLSTADPNKSANQPRLDPWRLSYYNEYTVSSYENKVQAQSNLNDNYFMKQEEQNKSMKQKGKVNYTTISVSELSIDLNVKTRYTVPSNSKPYIVDVTEYQLPATYKHICVPKVDREVYLLAQITEWEDLNLVEGQATVYFDDTYVGKSYISTRDVSDTLSLSLGRDKKVSVIRTKVKDFTSKQLIGAKKKETSRYQFDIKNNRKTAIDIDVIDQVPVSDNSEIEVTVDEISAANYNNLTGILIWNYKMQPDAKNQHFLQYTIKYPKNKYVNSSSKKFKTISCPSF
ncbi:MAG: hypothetical protein CVU05_02260 [Bacteroidetes bacterium HGW-Bacteroidetes-21]|jgi:uncharacterized protein (TIGR02231 family)|nr:MAG: hypothetical protein CVU05_02260 [Bacteroidetes bacterium HGW-Bacteroidetes-21]